MTSEGDTLRSAAARLVLLVAVFLVGFTVANTVLFRGSARIYEETLPVFQSVATRLREDPCLGRGPLFVWGFAPQLYAEVGLPPASRFVVPQASRSPGTSLVAGRGRREPRTRTPSCEATTGTS